MPQCCLKQVLLYVNVFSEFGKKKGKPGELESSSDEGLSDEEVELDDSYFDELRSTCIFILPTILADPVPEILSST